MSRTHNLSFAILGSGVSGVTTGLLLLEKYPAATVTIYTEKTNGIVSNVAGAQFYPIWLGDNLPDSYDQTLRKWFLDSKKRFIDLGAEAGVLHLHNYELFKEEPTPPSYFADVLTNFEIAEDYTLPLAYTHRFSFDTMMIDPLVYMPHILYEFLGKGGRLVKKYFGSLRDVTNLKEDIVFNCLGTGVAALFGDEQMKAVKGVVLRMKPVEALNMVVSAGDFIIAPRHNDVYFGASYIESWDSHEATEEERMYIFENNKAIMEAPGSIFSLPKGTFKKEDIIETLVGFRPVRATGPRVEKESVQGKTIIHNYGHGGNGIILSWGTGVAAVDLLN